MSYYFKGHSAGLGTLLNVLEYCLEVGISEVSVFAFAIENYQRSKEEVDVLMNLAKK